MKRQKAKRVPVKRKQSQQMAVSTVTMENTALRRRTSS